VPRVQQIPPFYKAVQCTGVKHTCTKQNDLVTIVTRKTYVCFIQASCVMDHWWRQHIGWLFLDTGMSWWQRRRLLPHSFIFTGNWEETEFGQLMKVRTFQLLRQRQRILYCNSQLTGWEDHLWNDLNLSRNSAIANTDSCLKLEPRKFEFM